MAEWVGQHAAHSSQWQAVFGPTPSFMGGLLRPRLTAAGMLRATPGRSHLNPRRKLAEGEGFEPPVGCPTTVFKTAALNRSANPPEIHATGVLYYTPYQALGIGKHI